MACLAHFATFCEAWLGIWPNISLYCKLFFLRARLRSGGDFVDCGGAIVYRRGKSMLPPFQKPDTVKDCQRTYFYVCNLLQGQDYIQLPCFKDDPPTKQNWGLEEFGDQEDVRRMERRIERLVEKGLTPRDITLYWLSNRLAPLGQRAHKMCFLSGLDDPTRLSSRNFKLEYMNLWLLHIAKEQPAAEGWEYGLKPFNRSKRPPQVRRALSSCLLFPAFSSSL